VINTRAPSSCKRFALARPKLLASDGSLSCSGAAPRAEMATFTLSHHFRVLRDAGLIRTTKHGVENLNSLRWDGVNGRFPGLLKAIMRFQL
jgi:hypothetical protein